MRGEKLTGWRKIANALWDEPNDPEIFGAMEIDATPLEEFARRARGAGHHVTPTHLVGRAIAQALRAVPELNVRLVGDRAIPRDGVDVFFITSVGRGKDLTGVKVARVDEKSAVAVGEEVARLSTQMKRGDDPYLAAAKKTMQLLPKRALRAVLHGAAWIAGEHATAIPAFGIPASPFGSAMISNVGMLGLPMGFSPLVFLYRVPLLLVVGEIAKKPVVVDDRVAIRPMLPVTATIDHRYVDGAQIAQAVAAFRRYMADPSAFEPPFDVSCSA